MPYASFQVGRRPIGFYAKANLGQPMNTAVFARTSKIPAVTLMFWVVKIAATTLGETGGDAFSMSLSLGYAVSTAIFAVFFIGSVGVQIGVNKFHPALYWAVIVATTLTGTTMADFADRSLGIGYMGGSAILLALVLASLAVWRFTLGSVSVDRIVSRKVEAFYWMTILFSNTLGTALGDLVSNAGAGFAGGAVIFGAVLAGIAGLYFFTGVSRTLLFWAAFVLTRPLGATLGDLLTKPVAHGGFDLNRFAAAGTIGIFMILCLVVVPSRSGQHPGTRAA
jgi:uncharacterized membrane-anchored protein